MNRHRPLILAASLILGLGLTLGSAAGATELPHGTTPPGSTPPGTPPLEVFPPEGSEIPEIPESSPAEPVRAEPNYTG